MILRTNKQRDSITQSEYERVLPSFPSLKPQHNTTKKWNMKNVGQQKAKTKKLVIDMQGNTGGYVSLAHLLQYCLWPNIFPFQFQADMPVTELNKLVHSTFFSGTDGEYSVHTDNFSYFHIMAAKPYPIDSYSSADASVTRKREKSQRFVPVSTDLSHLGLALPTVPAEIFNKILFNPQNIILIPDGACGSACAIFSKFARMRVWRVWWGLVVFLVPSIQLLTLAWASPPV